MHLHKQLQRAVLILFSVLLPISGAINGQTILDSSSVSPSVVDLSEGDQWVNVTLHLRNNAADILMVFVYIGHPDSADFIFGFAGLTSGTNRNGRWESEVYIAANSSPGIYPVYLVAYDNLFDETRINTGRSVEITGGDTQPPSLAGTPTITPPSIDVFAGPQEVTIDVPMQDDKSGVSTVEVLFEQGDTLLVASNYAVRVSGDNLDGIWQSVVTIPQWANGQLSLKVSTYDHAYNHATLSTGIYLTVTGGDTILPIVVGTPFLNRTRVNVSSGDQNVTLTLTAEDTYSGVYDVYAEMTDGTGNTGAYTATANLVAGDRLNGTWEVVLTAPGDTPADLYSLSVSLEDVAGNRNTQDFPGVTLRVDREPEAIVTFRLDTRRLERLGLLVRGLAAPKVRIFGGPHEDSYTLTDPNTDSIWTTDIIIQTGSTIHYAFAISTSTGEVLELDGSSGGRSYQVTTTDPVILPVVPFDDIAAGPVDMGFAAGVARSISPGDYFPLVFSQDTVETFLTLDFSSLDRIALLSVRRFAKPSGGALPVGIATIAQDLYWSIASAPAGAVFTTDILVKYNFFGGVTDPSALRLLRRTDSNAPWQVVSTLLDLDGRALRATGISAFGEWTIGSISSVNTLIPEAPGMVSGPQPVDGEIAVGRMPFLIWNTAANAYQYDLYLWESTEPMPGIPMESNLTTTGYRIWSPLKFNTTYHWKVVAKNIAGKSPGPVWTFTVLAVADLIVENIRVPTEMFSGRPMEVQWTVTNIGVAGTTVPRWFDILYLSTDSTLNTREDIWLGEAANMSGLLPGESYANTLNVMLPNGMFGSYRLLVVTDKTNIQNESDELNNMGVKDIQITLTPPPDLQVVQLSIPEHGFSGQELPIQYTVKNLGVSATTSALWYDGVYLSKDSLLNPATSVRLTAYRRTDVLGSDSSYTIVDNVRLPDTVSGLHYLFVYTDYWNHVYEYTLEDNNIRRSEIMISLSPPPDLVVTNVNAPSAGASGATIDVDWVVENQGSANAMKSWSDRVLISPSPTFDLESSTVIGTFPNLRGLERDSSYRRFATMPLPNGISGPYYVYVETDWKSQVFEYTFKSNNVRRASAATLVSLSPWPDLTPASVQSPSSATANDVVTVRWTVSNSGSAPIPSGLWTDSVYISMSSQWNRDSVRVLTGVGHNRSLGVSSSYTATAEFRLPADLPTGTYYIYVVCDSRNTIYEHTDEDNNIRRSDAIALSGYPPVNLVVTSLNHSPAGSSGMAISIEFTVRNIGAGTTLVNSWEDAVYLSRDTALDDRDLPLARITRISPLAGGESYTRSISPSLPNGLAGNYFLIVRTDSAGRVEDIDPSNNIRRSVTPVSITLSPSPDLQVTSLTAPPSSQAGQPLTIRWDVINAGVPDLEGQSWFDAVYLSANSQFDAGDLQLGSSQRSGPLPNGQSYTDSLEVTIPLYASGTFYLIVKADSRNEIYEHSAELNNIRSSILNVTLPPPADLVVSSITVAETGLVGREVTVQWTIRNQGLNPASGWMTDAVYFSADTIWDIGDLLLGTSTRAINLAPGASQRSSLRANLASVAKADSVGVIVEEAPGLLPGKYYIIVRTNIRNNIRESNTANNRRSSSSTVNVDVPILVVGIMDTGGISSTSPRFYKVDVPANLDLRITARSNIGYPTIDLFTAYDRLPSGSSYDFRTFDPISLTREVLVPSTQAGSYYLMMRSIMASSPYLRETYEVRAETLGFSIQSVTPVRGGSGGYVTGTLRGAGFRPTSRIFLYRGEEQVTEAELRRFRNTMELVIRWKLQDVPLGNYDVVVRNLDGSIVRLEGAFTVEPMRELTVSLGQSTPRVLLVGRKETYNFRFTNTSNVDIPYFFALIATPSGTELSVSTMTEGLMTRSSMIPDSIPDGAHVEDWIDNGTMRYAPLLGRDLPPGEAYDCRVVFRNSQYQGGEGFPMSVSLQTLTKEFFLEMQLLQIEALRAEILRNPAGVDLDLVARANDQAGFSRYALESYRALGLLDSTDIPSSGFQFLPTASAPRSLVSSQFPSGMTKSGTMPLHTLAAGYSCKEFFTLTCYIAAGIDCLIPLPSTLARWATGLCLWGFAACALDVPNPLGCLGIASAINCIAKELLCRDLVNSLDPNDIIGPEGVGDERWVARTQTLPYTIRFENDSVKATAPARRVTITQQLDTTADLRSFRLGSFGFGSHVFTVPENSSTYSGRLDVRDSLGIVVDVTAGLDITTRRVFWTFNSIDPMTGEPPADPFAGFLPVNDSTGRGNGFVNYTIKPNPSARTRDTLHAEARIIFDVNDPLDTPPIFNLIDAVAPQSRVQVLPDVVSISSFPVRWGGTDDSAGSGIRSYTIYVSRNGEAFTPWLMNTTDSIGVFSGVDSSGYRFFSIATDIAGNAEAFKSEPDAATTVVTDVKEDVDEVPKSFTLSQNYPNPFNPNTTLRYELPVAATVRITVYNVLGQEVRTLVQGVVNAGRQSIEWNSINNLGQTMASGVYFCRMEAVGLSDPSRTFFEVRKMVLMR